MQAPPLCTHCGHDRRSVAPSTPCAHCGNTAEGVRWWLRVGGGRDPSGVMLAALLVAVLSGSLLSACARASLDPLSTGFVASAAAIMVVPVLRTLLRRRPREWAFATLDGDRIGAAEYAGARLIQAYGVRVRDRSVEVPEYASAITAQAARSAGVRALGPGVCLALRIDEGEYGDLFPERALGPIVSAAIVGLAARKGCALSWQRGWRRPTSSPSTVQAFQRLAMTAGAAPEESLWLERRLLSALERLETLTAAAWARTDEGARDAHYRAPATVASQRFCTLDDLAADLLGDPSLREEFDQTGMPDAARAREAAIAFRAFAGAEPEVVEHLIGVFVDG